VAETENFELLAAANPIHHLSDLDRLFGEDVEELLLDAIREGDGAIEPTLTSSSDLRPMATRRLSRRAGWIHGLVAAAVVMIAGSLALFLGPTASPTDPVSVVEEWNTRQATDDLESARLLVRDGEWSQRWSNIYGFWDELGAGMELRECRQGAAADSVICTQVYTGHHYEAFGVPPKLVVIWIEDGLIQRLPRTHRTTAADEALGTYVAALDPDGLAAACGLPGSELGLVWTALPVVYKQSCGDFLAGYVDGWLASRNDDR
jgi:hypothetical protein